MKIFTSIALSLMLLIGVGYVAHAQVATGCTTTNGYNATTGASCNGATSVPAGCATTAGFSTSTGMPCNSNTAAGNGYNNSVVDPTTGYLSGCTSASGFSTSTGMACNTPINGLIYTGNGTTVNIGTVTSPVITAGTPTTDPGLPTTGEGSNTLLNLALLLASGTAVAIGIRYGVRQFAQ